jgi:hypothetical protein
MAAMRVGIRIHKVIGIHKIAAIRTTTAIRTVNALPRAIMKCALKRGIPMSIAKGLPAESRRITPGTSNHHLYIGFALIVGCIEVVAAAQV